MKNCRIMQKFKRLFCIYNLITALMLIIAGACLISGCLRIYWGIGKYSASAVSETFSYVRIPIYIALFLSIIGLILSLFGDNNKQTVKADAYSVLLERLKLKKDISAYPEAEKSIKAEEKSRKNRFIALSSLITACTVIFLTYTFVQAHWGNGDEITASVERASLVLIPLLIIPITLSAIFSRLDRLSILREIELLKTLNNKESVEKAEIAVNKRFVNILRISIIILAIIFVVFGVFSDGTADVLAKAKAICTECVGLG